jgi:hypothetical protein
MNMSKSMKWLMAALIVITAASVIAMAFMAAQRPDTDEDEEEAVKTPSHVSVQNGLTVIILGSQIQAGEDIRVTPLKQTSMRAELRGTAVLLAVNELATLRNSYVAAARTKLVRDQVDLSVLRSQYERVKQLYQQDQNMSLKAMQDAETAYRKSEAQLATDREDASLQLDVVRQRWGSVVTDWIATGAPVLESILEQHEYLAQVVFPPGEVAKPPAMLSLSLPEHHLISGRFVSPLPVVNQEVQGISFLYLVSDKLGIAVGMNLVAFVPVGQLLRGTIIPEGGIVWWQGRAWDYAETSPNTFTRREVPTQNPVPSGYFVPGSAFAPGTEVVTSGAQALLSEEFRSQIQQED